MKKVFASGIILLFFICPSSAFAKSNYVLPYPSFMPRSMFYNVHLAWEKIGQYWYFGNFSQHAYNLKLADKYLVESKTLFEYKQYLLAYQALKKSDEYFIAAYRFLGKAKQEGKNIKDKEQILKEAAFQHMEMLEQIKKQVPEQFNWQPEKDKPTFLFLREQINKAIEIRRSCV